MSRDLLLVCQLKATPLACYRCWTEADLLKKFFAPAPGRTLEAVIEPRPGGRFFTKMLFDVHGEIADEGCILHASRPTPDRPGRLIFTDSLSEGFRPKGSGFFTADIRFTAKDGGCEYRVIARHKDDATADNHAKLGFQTGWTAVAKQLEALARTLDAVHAA
ncbi:SRPBCC domain-containing protein [Thioclava sp. SK-1]|uniref:SRPBCC domain-containing protein n=1 Tax=Thioclava sp. SK-1 TaxID=1889770 RepID=UPI00159F0200|nr:SRPBCC domain-containing protein [Thioclava sp. SK-1]